MFKKNFGCCAVGCEALAIQGITCLYGMEHYTCKIHGDLGDIHHENELVLSKKASNRILAGCCNADCGNTAVVLRVSTDEIVNSYCDLHNPTIYTEKDALDWLARNYSVKEHYETVAAELAMRDAPRDSFPMMRRLWEEQRCCDAMRCIETIITYPPQVSEPMRWCKTHLSETEMEHIVREQNRFQNVKQYAIRMRTEVLSTKRSNSLAERVKEIALEAKSCLANKREPLADVGSKIMIACQIITAKAKDMGSNDLFELYKFFAEQILPLQDSASDTTALFRVVLCNMEKWIEFMKDKTDELYDLTLKCSRSFSNPERNYAQLDVLQLVKRILLM